MTEYSLLSRITTPPGPFDAERVQAGFESWREAAERQSADSEHPALAEFARKLADDPRGRGLLSVIFGNSPFLTQCLLHDIGFFEGLVRHGPEDCLSEVLAELSRRAEPGEPLSSLARTLRVARRRVALLTAVADIGDVWTLDQVTGALSRFAETALRLTTAQLLREAAAGGEIGLPDPAEPARGSAFAVLGMGKLGAGELNFSSDIDLIVLYDHEAVDYRGRRTAQDCFVRLTRDLVKTMQDRTADGYVFRTDLRLRPDPGATPLALSMAAAENYYESLGQNWERAAMIKARPVAGDIEAGRRFLERIRPFVWRKNLDFAAIEDIHSIKRQMHAHRGHGRIAVAGHDVKLGAGGIREIEFFAQTQQLIAGGRDPRLREATTCGALRALAASGRITAAVADDLIAAYAFLRRVEHRLQMIDDEQTHTLPPDEPGLERLALFLGHQSATEFADALLAVLNRVREHYGALFERAPALGGPGKLVFTGSDDDPATLETLADLGFRQLHTVADTVRKWHHGRYRAVRSARARELLTELMPRLLEALGRTAQPDAALLKFDAFLRNLPAGVQLFSLFLANPGLLDLVAEIMGTAPHLAQTLGRRPTLLDSVLSADFHDPLPDRAGLAEDLEAALDQTRDFQDVLDATRRWANDRKFQCGVQVLRNTIDAAGAGSVLADIAEVLLGALVPRVEAEFAGVHGRVAGAGLAVIAMGRLGGREMTSTSDVDLIFVYDHPDDVEASDGRKPLPPSQYFARLSQRIINAITAPTAEGRLYEVDMRLRPSGRAGPLAVRLDGFERYQAESAWTWEHMALTRARVVLGPEALVEAVERTIRATLCRPRDPAALAADVADMRRRLEKERATDDPWAIKYVRGGLVDVEFICQFLQLRFAADHPDVLDPNTARAFQRLGAAAVLAPDAAAELARAVRFLTNLRGLLGLCTEGDFDAQTAPEGLRAALVRAGGAPDFAALGRRLQETEAGVYRQYRRLIEDVAARPADDALHPGGGG